MEDIDKIISNNVRNRRSKMGMTQEYLAEKAELSQTGIQQIESGKRVPRPKTLQKLAEALNWKVYQLFMEDPYAIDPKPAETPMGLRDLVDDNHALRIQIKELEAQLATKNQGKVVANQLTKTEENVSRVEGSNAEDLSEIRDIIEALLNKPKHRNNVRAALGLPRIKHHVSKEDIG